MAIWHCVQWDAILMVTAGMQSAPRSGWPPCVMLHRPTPDRGLPTLASSSTLARTRWKSAVPSRRRGRCRRTSLPAERSSNTITVNECSGRAEQIGDAVDAAVLVSQVAFIHMSMSVTEVDFRLEEHDLRGRPPDVVGCGQGYGVVEVAPCMDLGVGQLNDTELWLEQVAPTKAREIVQEGTSAEVIGCSRVVAPATPSASSQSTLSRKKGVYSGWPITASFRGIAPIKGGIQRGCLAPAHRQAKFTAAAEIGFGRAAKGEEITGAGRALEPSPRRIEERDSLERAPKVRPSPRRQAGYAEANAGQYPEDHGRHTHGYR